MKISTTLRGAALAYAVAVVLVASGLAPAYAADTAATTVVIPWGDWLSSLLASVASLAIALLSFVVAKWAPAYVKVLLTDDLISKAVNYGFGAVEGAVAGKTLSLSTTNLVLAAAEQYAVSSAPAISKWLGANLRPLILAKLSALGVVPADATAEATGAAVAAK
ncbi:hypothetical protein SAMN06265338_12429 [Rhodoblastus acidophilus]|uniref:Holin n=1 Tax=Rhodoblastus acidophilus TaxID=1074 RepID=A0A212SC90_RHOAC|nr:hypothetical protein [Rhodoblastus acidophilus]SNB83131.1 hypothetical protein SAMN06265338_12429 [Rhodoblastus acidophilus]